MNLFSYCFRSQKNKKIIFNLAYKKFEKYYDFLEVAKTLDQFNKLKSILFTKSQQKLFSYYKKPELLLSLNEEKQKEGDKVEFLIEMYNKIKAKEMIIRLIKD
jgi:hypothetical protein